MTRAPEPLAYTVDEAAHLLRISRSTLYKLVREGKLRLVKVAGRSLIPADSLYALLYEPA